MYVGDINICESCQSEFNILNTLNTPKKFSRDDILFILGDSSINRDNYSCPTVDSIGREQTQTINNRTMNFKHHFNKTTGD